MIRVPSAAPNRLSPEEQAAVTDALHRVVSNGPWILGPEVERFESEFVSYLGGGHAVGVGNGTDALTIAFSALDLPPGAGVLVAANEGGYAATALRLAGLEPVVMDVDEETMAPSVETALDAMRDSVAALVVTHLHGEATDVHALNSWRKELGLKLIEDCAQAHGARRAGKHVGLDGDAATFSFYPTKNLGAIGDAGAVVFADPGHAERARSIRQYGWGARFRVELPDGRNSRLDPLQAAVLSARLPFLDARNERRRSIAGRYQNVVAHSSSLRYHGHVESTVAHHAVIVADRRDALVAHFHARGIDTSVHYPYLLTEMPGLALKHQHDALVSARLRERILSIPCFPEMSEDEIDRVTQALEEWSDE